MYKTAIVTDTNSGLLPEEAERLGIHLIPMPVIVDEESFFEYVSITQADFFARLKGGAAVSTSQPSPGALLSCWDALWKPTIIWYTFPCPAASRENTKQQPCWQRTMTGASMWQTPTEFP